MNDNDKLIFDAATQGAAASIQTWVAAAGIREGQVQSAALITAPGSMTSTADVKTLQSQMSATITVQGVATNIADAFRGGR